MKVKNLHTVSLRFPGQGSSSQGKSGPKPRPNRRRRWETGIKFLYRAVMRRDDAGSYGRPPNGRGSKGKGGESRQIRVPIQTLKPDGELRASAQRNRPTLCRREKSLSFSHSRPYRNPTQVDEASSLRCAREPW